jgi:hypothetical protein
MASDTLSSAAERNWFIAQRWQEYDAEGRANLLRIVAVGLFYIVHLWSYVGSRGWLPLPGVLQLAGQGEIDQRFHVAVTLLAVAWSMLALGILLCLQQQVFPRWLPYLSTSFDVVLLTAMICLGAAARSPLVVGYFLIMILATLRINLGLIRFSTGACALAYLCVLGCAKWPATFGLDEFGRTAVAIHVPRYQQVITLFAILLAGVTLGQIVRRVRLVAEDYARRVDQVTANE